MRFSRTGGKTLCGFFFFGLLFFLLSLIFNLSCHCHTPNFSLFAAIDLQNLPLAASYGCVGNCEQLA
mgnify:CR=1 FL=1